jgi:hypothetical protein
MTSHLHQLYFAFCPGHVKFKTIIVHTTYTPLSCDPRQEEIVRPTLYHYLRVHSTCDQIGRYEAEVVNDGEVIVYHRDGVLPFI